MSMPSWPARPAPPNAYHITAPSPDGDGAARCMELAMVDAEVKPSEVTHVTPTGTSTPPGDDAEAEAISKVFGHRAGRPRRSKGVIGHTLAAAGAIEAVAVARP